MKIDKIYLDTNLLIGWFKWILKKKKRKGDEPKITKFLSEHEEISTFISSFSVIEIVGVISNDYKKPDGTPKYTLNDIKSFIENLNKYLKITVLEEKRIVSLPIKKLIGISRRCRHLADSIHVYLAEKEDIWFITTEVKLGRLKPYYPKIMTEKRLIKQFKKKQAQK